LRLEFPLARQRKIRRMDRLSKAAIHVPGLEVRVVERCGSTNTLLLGGPSERPLLLAAETQTAGRGRRGRKWRSAPGAGATFSILRRMRCTPAALVGLPIAVGAAAARALRALGARGVRLKWPNDLMARRRKLGGILIETRSAAAGAAAETLVVVGIGINCRRQPQLRSRLGRGVAALEELLPRPVARNAVIGAVGRGVLAALADWERGVGGNAAGDAPDARLSARAA
jgi:BirA family transcriptional regulator, biotin operon repressor / biotin---[acetyl-CoA-carboxylase] ligase